MRVLLDTCTFLWIISGAPELSKLSRELYRDPSNDVFLSVVSVWEISAKYALGKLSLPQRPERFVPVQREQHMVNSLVLDENSVLHLRRLPALHRDPFDRMLICQAISHGMTIMTPDELIAQYPVSTKW
jgi:PIN domain nuclease of toxin-antitoxin system